MQTDLEAAVERGADICQQADLAFIYGISSSRISQIIKEGVHPSPLARGKFDKDVCVKAFIDYVRNQNRGSSDLSTRKEELAIEREELKILDLKRKAAMDDGDLVRYDEVLEVQLEAMNLVSGQVQFMGTQIVDKLKLGPDDAEKAEAVVRATMQSIVEQFEVISDD